MKLFTKDRSIDNEQSVTFWGDRDKDDAISVSCRNDP